MVRHRSSRAFTLVELLVVVIVIGILSAIALPNFIGAQQKAKTANVRLNMRTTQISAEAYSTDSGGVYGDINLLAPYFPGGNNTLGGTAGQYPTNPMTGTSNETPTTGGPTTSAQIMTERASSPSTYLSKGQHSYDVVDGGSSYAVMGSDSTGTHLATPAVKRLVLSNQ